MDRVLAYVRDLEGASAAEYALILAIVGGALAAGMIVLAQTMSTAVSSMAACISTGTTPSC